MRKNNLAACLLSVVLMFTGCAQKKVLTTSHIRDGTETTTEATVEAKKDSINVVKQEQSQTTDSSTITTKIEIEYEPVVVDSVPVPVIKKKTITRTEKLKVTEDKTISTVTGKTQQSVKGNTNTVQKNDVTTQIVKQEKPVDPYVIRYIFYIIVLLAIIGFLLWIKKKLTL